MKMEEFDFTDAVSLRKKAEKLLKEQQKKAENKVYETDAKKLLHQLQVHQIELEMQNEELRKAYEATETALKKYTMLYDLAPMSYLTIEKSGFIVDLNFTAADLLGEKRIGLINSNIKFHISEESKIAFENFVTRVFSGNGKTSCRVMIEYDNKPPCQVYMEGIMTGSDEQYLLSVVDISSFSN
jgi:NurA-like 5'-3' nuclease